MSIKLKDTIYDLINNSDKLDGKDSSAFSLTSHTHNEYLTELPQHTHNYASTVKVGSTSYNVSNNIISLPAYPTLSSLDGAASSHTHDYLPLTGGTLTGSLIINSSDSNQLKINYTGTDTNAPSYIYYTVENTKKASTGYYKGIAYIANEVTSNAPRIGVTDAGIPQYWDDYTGTNKYTLLHTGNYTSYALPKSGGTMSGDIIFTAEDSSTPSRGIHFKSPNNKYLYAKNDELYFGVDSSTTGKIWHSANDGSGSGLDADTLDGNHATQFFGKGWWNEYNHNKSISTLEAVNNSTNAWNSEANVTLKLVSSNNAIVLSAGGTGNERVGLIQVGHASTGYAQHTGSLYLNKLGGKVYIGTTEAATINSNVASATKLQTARTIWGQSFDGTGNVDGDLYLKNAKNIMVYNTAGTAYSALTLAASNNLSIGLGTCAVGQTYIDGRDIIFQTYSSGLAAQMAIMSTGNVGIGTTNPSYKLDVVGSIQSSDTVYGKAVTAIGSTVTPHMPNINWYDQTGNTGFHVSYRLTETNKPLRFYYRTGTTYTQLIDIESSGLIKFSGEVRIGTNVALHSGNWSSYVTSGGFNGGTITNNLTINNTGPNVFYNYSGTAKGYSGYSSSGKYIELYNQVGRCGVMCLDTGGVVKILCNNLHIGPDIISGDAAVTAARYIRCVGKTGSSYINWGYTDTSGNIGELGFNYVGNASTSNTVVLGFHSSANITCYYNGSTTIKNGLTVSGTCNVTTLQIGGESITFTT